MTLRLPQRLPDPNTPWIDLATGRPTSAVVGYMRQLDFAVRKLIGAAASVAVASLADPAAAEGEVAFASNGRKAGEASGHGSGVLVYSDGTNWIAADTGAPVAA